MAKKLKMAAVVEIYWEEDLDESCADVIGIDNLKEKVKDGIIRESKANKVVFREFHMKVGAEWT